MSNYTVVLYKATQFGNNEMVWNVPAPDYDFTQHDKIMYENVVIRKPMLTTMISVQAEYTIALDYYDYLTIRNENGLVASYFINSIVGDRNYISIGVSLDVLTTHRVLNTPITGNIVRKHDTNPSESKFDYPLALQVDGITSKEIFAPINYSNTSYVKLIESAVDLASIPTSVVIEASVNNNIVVPKLKKPSHETVYSIEGRLRNHYDRTGALTLYDARTLDLEVLNTVRGLSGDGAISDSYLIPSEAVEVVKSGSAVTELRGKLLRKTSNLKLEIPTNELNFTPRNEAIKGIFEVGILSTFTKARASFPAYDLKDSIDENNYIKFDLWCDAKPSGSPYCAPFRVESLHPYDSSTPLDITTQDIKSVKGGQWLRNPLVYTTTQGEIFATYESKMARERSAFERDTALADLAIQQREREIDILSHNSEQAMKSLGTIGSGVGAAFTKGLGNKIVGGFSTLGSYASNEREDNLFQRKGELIEFEMQSQKQLIEMAHTSNLKNINAQEKFRRITPPTIPFTNSESLGAYELYNGFMVSVIIPDKETLLAKDIEYSKYGYPCYIPVENFIMTQNLRQNHTVFQFENPMVELGGIIGDMVREVLQGGIRILSKKYTTANILNNPKR